MLGVFRILLPIFASLAEPSFAAPPGLAGAVARRAQGDLRGALALAEAAAVAHPGESAGWALVGDLRYSAGDRAGARDAYEAALAAAPGDGRIAGLIDTLRSRPGMPLTARTATSRGEAAYVRALTAFNAGQIGPATELAAGVVAAAPEHHDAWALLGRCRLARGDRTGATDAFAQSLALRPDQPEVIALREESLLPPGDAGAAMAGLTPSAASSRTTTGTSTAPVLPGPVRTGESSLPVPPPSIRYPGRAAPSDPEWPLPESPGAGVQGPLSRGERVTGRGRTWSIALGAGVAGAGLGALCDDADEQFERSVQLARLAGSSASVEADRGGPRAPIGLELRRTGRPGAGLRWLLELTPSSEDRWRFDQESPATGFRTIRTERRRTGLFGASAGGWFEHEVAPRWRVGGSAALGGIRAWFDQIVEREDWWVSAGPPDRSREVVEWTGWGWQFDFAVEAARELAGPLTAWMGAGWRIARVPRMSATVIRPSLDATGAWRDIPRSVTLSETGGMPTALDFSAVRASLGLRLAL